MLGTSENYSWHIVHCSPCSDFKLNPTSTRDPRLLGQKKDNDYHRSDSIFVILLLNCYHQKLPV